MKIATRHLINMINIKIKSILCIKFFAHEIIFAHEINSFYFNNNDELKKSKTMNINA